MKNINMYLMALFLVLIFSLFAGAHAFIYFSTLHFFAVSTAAGKFVLGSLLIFLASSFFLSSLAAHFFNNFLMRGFYYVSALWVGLMVNLLLAFFVAWVVAYFVRNISSPMGNILIGTVAILFALVWSVYGAWNAFHPVVTEVVVPIKNLPSEWKGKKIVQLSDVHLGFVYREDSIAQIVQRVNVLKPDVVVITGDLFDGSDGDLEWAAKALKNIVAPKGVYYVTGNHETYLGLDKALGVLNHTNIILMHDTTIDISGLQFVGIDYPLQNQKKDIAQAIMGTSFDKNKPSVLLYHAPVNVAKMKELGISLMLSGHTHVGQLFPFSLITNLIYKGYDYGLKREGDFSIYTTNGIGTWGPPMRTGNRPEIVDITLE